jgi:hypothetical protein
MKEFVHLVLSGILLTSVAQPASAQTSEERAGARAAAEQGVKAFNEGRWADAADLMSRAEKLFHAPTHLLYLAQAEEKLGHLVNAHEIYLRISRERLGRDAPEVFLAAQEDAKKRADAVRARLGQVSVTVQGAPAGAAFAVTMDGKRVPDALVGVPHPADPGEHLFEASADGMRSNPTKAILREGATASVTLTLLPAEDANLSQPGVTPGAPAPTTSDTPAAPEKSSGSRALKIGGFIGLGVGAAGVGAGTVLLIMSKKARSDANALCTEANGVCPTENRAQVEALDSKADSRRNAAIGGFIAAGVGITAGVTMLVLAPFYRGQSAFIAPYFTEDSLGVWGKF